jgi:hypothetical protein
LTREETTVKSATKLLTAAFALAAIVSTALPMAQTAEAQSGPDLEASTGLDAHISRNAGDGGGAWIYATVKNVGTAKSAPTMMLKYCGYLPTTSSRQIDWVAVDVAHQLVPALAPQGGVPDGKFYCPTSNGRTPVAARMVVAASQGDTNLSNNKATTWIFKLD